MVPVPLGFIAFTADRPGSAPGFIGGCWPACVAPVSSDCGRFSGRLHSVRFYAKYCRSCVNAALKPVLVLAATVHAGYRLIMIYVVAAPVSAVMEG